MWLRPGSPRPRKRKISLSVSALRICSSMSGRIAGEGEATEVEASTEEGAAASVGAVSTVTCFGTQDRVDQILHRIRFRHHAVRQSHAAGIAQAQHQFHAL